MTYLPEDLNLGKLSGTWHSSNHLLAPTPNSPAWLQVV